uniref:Transmembrane protein n=1 Tax=Panagrellus redivivus TaxID=6233 RepID=A0A7E4V642_PANRE
MQPYFAILLMLLLVLGPLVGTVLFALCLHLAVVPTSFVACGLFFVLCILHIAVLAHLRVTEDRNQRLRPASRSSRSPVWNYIFHGPVIDIIGVLLQFGTGAAGIYLSLLNKEHSTCANHRYVAGDEGITTTTPNTVSGASADCDGATVLFLAALMVFTLRCYSLPPIVRLRMLTKKLRTQSIYADPRLRLATHELFNGPSSQTQCRAGRAQTVGVPIYMLPASAEFLPPPPSYEESQTLATPPSYSHLFSPDLRTIRAATTAG